MLHLIGWFETVGLVGLFDLCILVGVLLVVFFFVVGGDVRLFSLFFPQ